MNKVKLTPEDRAYIMEEIKRMMADLPPHIVDEICLYAMTLWHQQQAEQAAKKGDA